LKLAEVQENYVRDLEIVKSRYSEDPQVLNNKIVALQKELADSKKNNVEMTNKITSLEKK